MTSAALSVDRVRNYRNWCAARVGSLSGAEIGVALAEHYLDSLASSVVPEWAARVECGAMRKDHGPECARPRVEPPAPAISEELKPCPFCGADRPKLLIATEVKRPTTCASCENCCAEGPPALTRERAVERWNVRQSCAPKVETERPLTMQERDMVEHAYWSSVKGASSQAPKVEHAQLFRFYSVDNVDDLIAAQLKHIQNLQSKLPPARDEQPRNYREG